MSWDHDPSAGPIINADDEDDDDCDSDEYSEEDNEVLEYVSANARANLVKLKQLVRLRNRRGEQQHLRVRQRTRNSRGGSLLHFQPQHPQHHTKQQARTFPTPVAVAAAPPPPLSVPSGDDEVEQTHRSIASFLSSEDATVVV